VNSLQQQKLLLQVCSMLLPMISTAGQITNCDTQLSDLLLFLSRTLLPLISADAEFPRFANSIGFVGHLVFSVGKPSLAGPSSGMNSNVSTFQLGWRTQAPFSRGVMSSNRLQGRS